MSFTDVANKLKLAGYAMTPMNLVRFSKGPNYYWVTFDDNNNVASWSFYTKGNMAPSKIGTDEASFEAFFTTQNQG
jgi:hypothetical protein